MTKKARKHGKARSNLFQGCVFAFIRLAPPSNGVDYDTKELESCVSAHGGKKLSSALVDALRVDKASGDHELRNCYVVCWGGYTPVHTTVHPLLSRVEKEKLCNVIPVSPVWLLTCSTDRKLVAPERRPVLFQPQAWPTRRLPESLRTPSKTGGIRASVTGFVGTERTGIVHVLQSLGADYTESMRSSNTHLICKECKGPKYDKAVEWGLLVVSIDWLYHIMEFGYRGKGGSEDRGCEERFSLVPDVSKGKPTSEEKQNGAGKVQGNTTDDITPNPSQASDGSTESASLNVTFESQWSQEVVGTEQDQIAE